MKKEPYIPRHHPAMHALNHLDPSHARACIIIFKRRVGGLFGGWVYGENLCRKETTRSSSKSVGEGEGQRPSKDRGKQEQPHLCEKQKNSLEASISDGTVASEKLFSPKAQSENEGERPRQGSADEMTANEQRDAEKYRKNTCKRPSTAPSSSKLTISNESSHVLEENRPVTSPVTSPANSGRSFNFTQDDIFEKHLKHYQQIVSNGDVIEFRLCKLILVGPPRVGKSSLIRRLLGEALPMQSPSTPVAESPQKAIIHSVEAEKTLMCGTTGEKVCILKMGSLSDEVSFWLSQVQSAAQRSPKHDCAATCLDGNESKIHESHDENKAAQFKQFLHYSCAQSTISSLSTCNDAIQLNIIDTGGQPEFQEILPLIINGPAVHILVFKANESIKKHNEIVYESEDHEAKRTIYQTNMTTEEVILKSIATIQSFAVHESKHEVLHVRGQSTVVLVATHCNSKDGLSEEEKYCQIKELNDKVMQSFTDFTGMDAKDRIVKIDNMTSDKEEFDKLRSFLKKVIDDRRFTITLPPQWLALYFTLQRENKSHMKISDVEVLAKDFDINTIDLKTALWFLHHCAGSVMYFEDVEELRDTLFLDIQQVFDCVTALIAETFVPSKTTFMNKVMAFNDTGKFKAEDIEHILTKRRDSLKQSINLRQIICLLRHLHILTVTKDGSYFLPCVLKSEELRLPSTEKINEKPPLLIRFNTGPNPSGLFFSMINHLINVSRWELASCDEGKYYRNKMAFRIGSDEDMIIMIDCLQYFEVHAFPTDNAARDGKFQHCTVRMAIEDAITSACKTMSHTANFSSDALHIGFYCDCCGDPVHCMFLRPEKDDMNKKRILCNKKGSTTDLSEKQKKWLEDTKELIIPKESSTDHSIIKSGTIFYPLDPSVVQEAFRKSLSYLRSCINPDDITTQLFEEKLITEEDWLKIRNAGYDKRDALLEALQLSINRDEKKFMATFLNILNAKDAYKIVAKKLSRALEDTVEEFVGKKEVLQSNTNTSPSCMSRPSPNAESTWTASKDTVDSARKDILATGSALLGQPQTTSEDTTIPSTAQEIILPALQNTQPDTLIANIPLTAPQEGITASTIQMVNIEVTTIAHAAQEFTVVNASQSITSGMSQNISQKTIAIQVEKVQMEESTIPLSAKELRIVGTQNIASSTPENTTPTLTVEETNFSQAENSLQKATATVIAQRTPPGVTVHVYNEPQERLSSELHHASVKTMTEVESAAVNTLYDDAAPCSTQVTDENRPQERNALNNARTVTDVSMTQSPLKSEKQRARNAFKKCDKSLSRLNFDLLYLKLKENKFISAKKDREYLAYSKPDGKYRLILEAVEEAIKDTAMFKKFLKIITEQGRASDQLIKKLQEAFDE